ncbi:hypothetical protein HRbin20_00893 [bacterium HR20]|nr:hypothetical protein HRbin20_00893 [bacterium HR20]
MGSSWELSQQAVERLRGSIEFSQPELCPAQVVECLFSSRGVGVLVEQLLQCSHGVFEHVRTFVAFCKPEQRFIVAVMGWVACDERSEIGNCIGVAPIVCCSNSTEK